MGRRICWFSLHPHWRRLWFHYFCLKGSSSAFVFRFLSQLHFNKWHNSDLWTCCRQVVPFDGLCRTWLSQFFLRLMPKIEFYFLGVRCSRNKNVSGVFGGEWIGYYTIEWRLQNIILALFDLHCNPHWCRRKYSESSRSREFPAFWIRTAKTMIHSKGKVLKNVNKINKKWRLLNW